MTHSTVGKGVVIAALASCAVAVAVADETQVKLVEAPEAASVREYCSSCHSLDYVQMNSPFMKRAGWEAEVRKMIKVMGAPVPDAAAADITGYLVRHYGVE